MKWALTGTPGTGKTTVASSIQDLDVVHLNELIEDPSFQAGYDEERGTAVADIAALSDWIHNQSGPLLVESHLAHLLPVDRVIVLRCHPDVLYQRLTQREAPHGVDENVEAERLDLILTEAVERHEDEVFEIDTTDLGPGEVTDRVVDIIEGNARPRPGAVSFLTDT